MRKLLIPLMICLILLSGCGNSAELKLAEFSDSVANAEEISFVAEISAQYDEKTVNIALDCSKNADETVIEIVKPEIIAGIKAKILADTATLEYDGAVLDLGSLTDGGLSPVSAIPILLKAMSEGYVEAVWTEDGMLTASLTPSDDLAVKLRLSEELVPKSAEISSDGKTVIYITISDWEIC